MKKYMENFNLFDFVLVFLSVLLKYLKFTFDVPLVFMYLLFATMIILDISILSKIKIKKNDIIQIVITSILCLVITLLTSSIDFAMPLLFAIYFRKKGIKIYLFYLFLSGIFCFTATIILNGLGLLESNVMQRLVNGEIVTRNSLGFEHVNSTMMHWFSLIVLFYILFEKKIINYAIIAIISYFLFRQTDCRTGFYVILIFITFTVFFEKKEFKFLKNNGQYLFIFLTLITIILCKNFGDSDNIYNEIASNRFLIGNSLISQYGLFSIIGFDIPLTTPIDNIYLFFLLRYGLIAYFTIIYIFMTGFKKIDNQKYRISIITFFIYCLFESNYVYYINFSFFILIFYIINGGDIYVRKKD